MNPDIFEDPDVREYLELFASDNLSEVGPSADRQTPLSEMNVSSCLFSTVPRARAGVLEPVCSLHICAGHAPLAKKLSQRLRWMGLRMRVPVWRYGVQAYAAVLQVWGG